MNKPDISYDELRDILNELSLISWNTKDIRDIVTDKASLDIASELNDIATDIDVITNKLTKYFVL